MASGLDKQPLPSFRFSCDAHAQRQRFDAWAGEVAPLFDVAPTHEDNRFEWSIEAHLLNGIVVGQSRFSGQAYRRDRRLVARTGLDAYLVQLYTKGGFHGRADQRDMSVRAGDVCIFDLTATLATETEDSGTVTLVVPKLLVDRSWNARTPVHGLTLSGDSALGQVMGAHLASLMKAMPVVTSAEAPGVADITAQLIASCFAHGTGEDGVRHGLLERTLHQRAMSYIRANLHYPELSTESICAALRVSRPHLYRAFRDSGGVMRSILDQRLRLAFAELTHPAHRTETIGSIAFRCGFVSVSHFTRVFQEAFGARPSDVRDGRQAPTSADGRPGLPLWLSPDFTASRD